MAHRLQELNVDRSALNGFRGISVSEKVKLVTKYSVAGRQFNGFQ